MKRQIARAMKDLVRDLVSGRFDEVERDGRSGRASASDLKAFLGEYPGTLTMPPDEAFEEYQFQDDPDRNVRFRIVFYDHASPPRGIAEFDLWFDNEPGDLMIACMFSFQNGQLDKFTFYDMRVP